MAVRSGLITAALLIGKGMENTNQIYARLTTAGAVPTANYAAGIAWAYSNNGKTDWHLPSYDELNQMCKWNRGVLWTSDAQACAGGSLNSPTYGASGFSTTGYWTSSERSDGRQAYFQLFGAPIAINNYHKKDGTSSTPPGYFVRAVRAFG